MKPKGINNATVSPLSTQLSLRRDIIEAIKRRSMGKRILMIRAGLVIKHEYFPDTTC
jgi:hypothetical protein